MTRGWLLEFSVRSVSSCKYFCRGCKHDWRNGFIKIRLLVSDFWNKQISPVRCVRFADHLFPHQDVLWPPHHQQCACTGLTDQPCVVSAVGRHHSPPLLADFCPSVGIFDYKPSLNEIAAF